MNGVRSKLTRALARLPFDASLTPVLDRPKGPIDEAILALAQANIADWTRPPPSSLRTIFADLNSRLSTVYVFEFSPKGIYVWPKPNHVWPEHLREQLDQMEESSAFRARLYKKFIERALSRRSIGLRTILAIDVGDIGYSPPEMPLLCFQKAYGCHNILLPDIDFFVWWWYEAQIDLCSYDRKAIRAGFVGSSTGGPVDVEAIRSSGLPRLRSAAHFVGNPRVSFRIARSTMYADAPTRAFLEAQPYFTSRRSWREQRRDRFLLSIDGNGATCSRVAIALKSRCVLVRYRSPYRLFYFDHLVPGHNCLEIEEDRDIEPILDREEASPGYFRPVAEAGTRLFERYLTKSRLLDYTAALLTQYAGIVGDV